MERSDREPTADGTADASTDPVPARRVIHVGRVEDDDLDDDIPELPDDEDDVLADDALDAETSDTRFDDGVQIRSRVRPTPRRRRGGIAPTLLLFGASLWAAVAILRCRGTDELPPVAVPTEQTPGEPADASPDDAAPEPAADRKRTEAQPDAPVEPDAAPPADGWPKPVKPEWADGLELPTTVRYTIRRGGTLENVANLFRVFHHEILENNPGIEIDKELDPDTRVVVWRRKDGKKSESIGLPSKGSIEHAVPMVEGPGRRLLAVPNRTWATAETVAVLDRVLDRWADRDGDVQPILVGNMSNREGGKLEPHSTHQSGRDVDLGYPQKLAKGAELTWQEIRADNLDAAETWELLKLLVETEAVEEIYIDRSIQKLLHEDAVANERVPEASLKRWMEYPRPTGTSDTMIKHVPGHTDHLHVRFACPKSHARCKSR